MAFYKNVASQKIPVYAFDEDTGLPVTGDAANITAEISKDGGTSAATNDANPTEIDATDHPGWYLFDMTQTEMNADLIHVTAVSATSGTLLDPVVIATLPGSSSGIHSAVQSVATDAINAAAIATDAVSEIQSGLATSSALATVDNNVDAILLDTDELQQNQGDWATATGFSTHSAADVATELGNGSALTEAGGTGDHLTAIPWNAAWDAQVQSEVIDALQETIPDSVPADGSRPNVQQALYMITQILTEFEISSTTLTVKKPDGTTSLFTLTLNDATNPTSLTRAT